MTSRRPFRPPDGVACLFLDLPTFQSLNPSIQVRSGRLAQLVEHCVHITVATTVWFIAMLSHWDSYILWGV